MSNDITYRSEEELDAGYAKLIEVMRRHEATHKRGGSYIRAVKYDYLVMAWDGPGLYLHVPEDHLSLSEERSRVLASHIAAALAADATRDEYFAAVRFRDERDVEIEDSYAEVSA
jgi:hypothetical protein